MGNRGCLFSCITNKSEPFDCVRVIHINGHIQDFATPVTPSQVIGTPPRHVLCTAAQLLSTGSRPLRPDHPLERGRVYFLVPTSVFESDMSSLVGLATLVAKLTAIANRAGPADPVNGKPGRLPGSDQGAGGVSGSGAWKPDLETIREGSLRGRESVGSFRSTSELLE